MKRGMAGLALAAMLGLAAPAAASTTQESVFEDEHVLLSQGPEAQARGLDEMRALGADTIRTLVYWNSIAPSPRSKKRPAGFAGRNPAAYPAGSWDRYDDLVRGAAARGMEILFTPSSPIPAWASDCKGSVAARRTCRPHAKLFGDFVRALGTRYSGTYADENQGGGVLPRVDRWSIWNEPNIAGWLTPQYVLAGRRARLVAPGIYRRLVSAGTGALRATGHASDVMLLGETAPIGSSPSLVTSDPDLSRKQKRRELAKLKSTPTAFLEGLFCMDSRGRRLTGGAARALKCGGGGRLAVSGYAHHPYTVGAFRPLNQKPPSGGITITTSSRLKRLLDRGARRGRIRRSLPIWYTEFGFQTNPPDRAGVSFAKQAEFLNQADWIAFNDRRVRSVAQYKLLDETSIVSFQTGLRRSNGALKPAYDAYRLPIWVVRRGSSVRVFGQVRPAADRAAETVEIQNGSGGSFTTVQTVPVTSAKGHFAVNVPARAGTWRLRWTPAGGATVVSREARAAKR